MPARHPRPNPLFTTILAMLGSLAPLAKEDSPIREFARTMDRIGTSFGRQVAEATSLSPIRSLSSQSHASESAEESLNVRL